MTVNKADNISSIPIDGFSNLRITSLWTFFMSVQWSEPWLIGLLVFHAVCLFLTLLTCKYYRAQICHFLLVVGLVYSAEYLNELAARNWRSFSNFQYFDSKGMFISLVFSIPLLLNAVIIVVCLALVLGIYDFFFFKEKKIKLSLYNIL
uniref:Transmembrane protein 18 n=1 Tax=Pundamilia nyererei TaxID=303518 RepID=A0A3B4FRV9_9CICH